MRRSIRLLVLCCTLAALAAGGVAFASAGNDGRDAPRRSAAADAARREQDIAFYRERAARDPESAADLARLAALYLQRARAGGANTDLERAEATARRSLALRVAWNAQARLVLASALLAQHRFVEALAETEPLLAGDPQRPSYLALRGELEMELGRYDDARRTFRALAPFADELSVAPRLARWAELEGRPEEAWRLLRRARDRASSGPRLAAEQAAWYELRLGDVAFRAGRLRAAANAYRAALEHSPDDYRALADLARLASVRHRWQEALDLAERSMAHVLDPALLGLAADAHAAQGDTAEARAARLAMATVLAGQRTPFHRAWSLYELDRGGDASAVLSRAEAELASRRDVYGDDVVAWALHRLGRSAEARAAIYRALRLGTRDAMLLFHAGMIERAAGDPARAATLLRSALAINPHWDPFQPAEARAALAELRRRSQGGSR